MRTILLFVLFIESVCPARAAFSTGRQNPVALGMGGASAALVGRELGVWSNPGLLSLSGRFASVSFSPGLYGLSELSSGSAIYVEPFPVTAVALSGSVFGFDLYREITLSVAAGWELASDLNAGIEFDYYHLRIAGYGTGSTFGVSAGVVFRLRSDLAFAFALRNLNRPVISERLPSEFRLGTAYEPVEGLTVAIDLTKDSRFPFDLHLGVEYSIAPSFDLRVGGSTGTSTVSGGFAVRSGPFSLDYALNAHPALGLTYLASVSFRFRP